jgi:hypothetical protein
MKRSGLVVAGGVLSVVRGVIGLFATGSSFAALPVLEPYAPGIGAIVSYEFVLAVVILVVGIWALVRSNRPESGSAITGWGLVIIISGVVDLVWGIAVLGNDALASGFGSVVALALIGGLLFAGGRSLRTQAAGPAAAF